MDFWIYALAFGYLFCGLGAVNLDIRSGLGRPAYVRDRNQVAALVRLLTWPWRESVLGSIFQLLAYTAVSAGILAAISWLVPIEWGVFGLLALMIFLFISNLVHMG